MPTVHQVGWVEKCEGLEWLYWSNYDLADHRMEAGTE